MACELYCCLLPQCEALRTYRSGFPIATLVTRKHPWRLTDCGCFHTKYFQNSHCLLKTLVCLNALERFIKHSTQVCLRNALNHEKTTGVPMKPRFGNVTDVSTHSRMPNRFRKRYFPWQHIKPLCITCLSLCQA